MDLDIVFGNQKYILEYDELGGALLYDDGVNEFCTTLKLETCL